MILKSKKKKIRQYKRPISIKNVDINKIAVSSEVSFVKKGFKYFISYKDSKKLDLDAYFFQ